MDTISSKILGNKTINNMQPRYLSDVSQLAINFPEAKHSSRNGQFIERTCFFYAFNFS